MRVWALLLLLATPSSALAQGVATLVADTVTLHADDRLSAQGNVEAFFGEARLTASAITYDRTADRLLITGPIQLIDPTGAVLIADSADLDPRLQAGILRGARLVLDQQLQLAAVQIARSQNRLTQLYRTTVSSCSVCDGRPPLWDIRAERVVHDQGAQQLYFTNATLHLRGLPIFWLPSMRLPDPTLARATGFLIPRLRTTDRLGSGLKTPYFLRLGDSRDLTITPYVSTETATLEGRYRQAFRNGDLSLSFATSRDTLRPDEQRAYLFADGSFTLAPQTTLRFDVETVSDRAYLIDYGYSDKDRLDSAVRLTRVSSDQFFDAGVTVYQTLRSDESNRALPPYVIDARYSARSPGPLGTQLRYGLDADAILREGDFAGPQGRDVTRIGAFASLDHNSISSNGFQFEASGGLRADAYRISDDPAYPRTLARTVPHIYAKLAFPLVAKTPAAKHLIEPAIAIGWSDSFGDMPPNEDSNRPEFDRANLFGLSRFPGEDAVETGLRVAAGMTWTRHARDGTYSTLSFGRVARETPDNNFGRTSGLTGYASDWLLEASLKLPDGLALQARSLVNDDFTPTMTEARVDWQTDRIDLGAAYIWQIEDPARGRDEPISELKLDTTYQLTPTWAVGLDSRYDLQLDRPVRTGVDLQWRNECVIVDFSVARRYTRDTEVEPSTDYGLSVTLSGFSTGRSGARPPARCNRG